MERYSSGNVLFEEVNEIFTSSSFGVIEDSELDETSMESPLPTFWKPRKGLERWPMFYLRFKIDSVVTEDALQPRSSTLAVVISLLRAVCYAFLRRHKMRPRKLLHTRQKSSLTEGGNRTLPFQNNHTNTSALGILEKSSGLSDNWRRIKVGHRAGMAVPQSSSKYSQLVGSGGQLLRVPFVDGSHNEACAGTLCIDADSHTLRDYPTRPFETFETRCPEGNEQWLEKLVQNWKNPVFDTVEPAVYQLSTDLGDFSNGGDCHSASTNISGSLSRSSLAKAKIIAQVDSKFVLIKVPLPSPVTSDVFSTDPARFALFAVDQHAADERCRLEELMTSYFQQAEGTIKPVVEPLDQSLSFDMSRKELDMFAKWKSFWEGWGIRLAAKHSRAVSGRAAGVARPLTQRDVECGRELQRRVYKNTAKLKLSSMSARHTRASSLESMPK
ncbi:DNA mismatch repair protein (Mlh3), putative [Cordyceps militaris CM01]|uniref:DNA mismatch repair protein (Mlh3), putative n=1 Tax=Cordyceps militaris (strain CM01) TaxID=983644 RepID=G3J8C1_CORMM|nr:DNA mismatch repair protein (Mlh3), putative [Cordyceps militaris CM01]EGX93910.1 DNA mismatch repair protein (Mlh3), putative [Cordyceps militaris CM01]